MHRILVMPLLAILLSCLVVATMPAAANAYSGAPQFVSPPQGATVANGTNTMTIYFPNAGTDDTGQFWLYVWNDTYDYDETVSITGVTAGQTRTVTIPAMTTAGTYFAYLDDTYTSYADYDVEFTVEPPPITLTNVAVSPAEFYPLVQDGYRDKTTIGFRLSRYATIDIKVTRASDGARVRHTAITRSAGASSWAWDGRSDNGSVVPTGAYHIDLTAVAKDGSTATRRTDATVATAWTTKRVTQSRWGDNPASTGHSRYCYVDYHYNSRSDLYLDCWNGRYALANYGFTIPSSAYNLGFWVNGERYCCNTGIISKTGKRLSSTAYRVAVKVTGTRAFDVESVSISYYAKVRI